MANKLESGFSRPANLEARTVSEYPAFDISEEETVKNLKETELSMRKPLLSADKIENPEEYKKILDDVESEIIGKSEEDIIALVERGKIHKTVLNRLEDEYQKGDRLVPNKGMDLILENALDRLFNRKNLKEEIPPPPAPKKQEDIRRDISPEGEDLAPLAKHRQDSITHDVLSVKSPLFSAHKIENPKEYKKILDKAERMIKGKSEEDIIALVERGDIHKTVLNRLEDEYAQGLRAVPKRKTLLAVENVIDKLVDRSQFPEGFKQAADDLSAILKDWDGRAETFNRYCDEACLTILDVLNDTLSTGGLQESIKLDPKIYKALGIVVV